MCVSVCMLGYVCCAWDDFNIYSTLINPEENQIYWIFNVISQNSVNGLQSMHYLDIFLFE